MSEPLPSLADLLDVDQTGPNTFISKRHPERLGNIQAIAFGGCLLGCVITAAYKTLPTQPVRPFHIYSVLGHFHGPTRSDRHINIHIDCTRDTKTFATRRIIVSQTQDDSNSSERTCAELLIDFHAKEAIPPLFTFSPSPSRTTYSRDPSEHSQTVTLTTRSKELVDQGFISQKQADANLQLSTMSDHYFENRYDRDGLAAIALYGQGKTLPHHQDHLPPSDRACAEWIRPRESQDTEPAAFAAIIFTLDQGLSLIPLEVNHLGIEDVSACSTLDFSVRFLKPIPSISEGEWWFRERKTMAAGEGRTINEARLWEARPGEGDGKGDMIAVMTQTCILRRAVARKIKGERVKANM